MFVPNILKPTFGYGDIKGTGDAALFIIGQDSLEVLIVKGKKNSAYWLYNLLVDGELDAEIDVLIPETENKKMVA